MKKIVLILAVAIMAAVTSCGVTSDKTTEKQLDGTWTSNDSETEDGVTMNGTETLTLDASTNEFTQELKLSAFAYGEYMPFGTIKLSGKWSASKEEINFDFTEDDIELDIDSDFLSEMGGKKALIKEIMESNGSFKIVKLNDDAFTLRDDEGEKTEYTRAV